MSEFVKKLVKYILNKRKERAEKAYKKLAPKTYANSTTRTHIDSSTIVRLTTETEKNKEQVDFCVKNIVKQYINNPDGLLDYIDSHGTKVYKFDKADFFLSLIKEDEGFITPLKGIKAFYLNLIVGIFCKKKLNISFESEEMFVLRDLPVNVYYMMHQFHKWYGFKADLPGYDTDSQELFKESFEKADTENFEEMSIEEIISIQEAIARDREAIEFVVNLSKEYSGAKKALKKIKDKGSASI